MCNILKDGITRISPILPCVLFPYISGFIASAFIRLVRFAVLRQTCAPPLCRFAPMPCMFPSFAPIERGLTMQSPFNWSEIDGITHIVFLPCSFAIRDIFLFAHYGFLQVRQVCARRKLAHPRYVALLHNRAMIPSFAPKQWDSQTTVPLLWSERRDSNPQQPAWEAGILPLNYFRLACRYYITVPFILQ